MKNNKYYYKEISKEEKIIILKNDLLKYYYENKKFTHRGISSCEYLPSMKYIMNLLDSKNEDISKIYTLCEIKIDKGYANKYLNRRKIKYEEIVDFLKYNKCTLLTKKHDYKNINTLLRYICSCGNISKIKFSDFKKGHRCYFCGIEKNTKKRRTNFETIKQTYEENNCILLSKKHDYKNRDSKLKFVCRCGNIHISSFVSFKISKNCNLCGRVKGENHYEWKGGITPLHEYLRGKIYSWKNESLKYHTSRCVITNKKSYTIHHLYPFYKILQETMFLLNMPIYENINKYTTKQLDIISSQCLELHYKYGLGVCISNDVHNLFHNIYGNKNNTPEQFYEFQELITKKYIYKGVI